MAVQFFIGTVTFFIALFLIFKKQIRKKLYRLKIKLQMVSLREAIHDADKNKNKTGRKNMVVYNTSKDIFEPIQKKQLKAVARVGKNKNNKAMTPGRKKMLQKRRRSSIDMHRVKVIEKKSLYITQ